MSQDPSPREALSVRPFIPYRALKGFSQSLLFSLAHLCRFFCRRSSSFSRFRLPAWISLCILFVFSPASEYCFSPFTLKGASISHSVFSFSLVTPLGVYTCLHAPWVSQSGHRVLFLVQRMHLAFLVTGRFHPFLFRVIDCLLPFRRFPFPATIVLPPSRLVCLIVRRSPFRSPSFPLSKNSSFASSPWLCVCCALSPISKASVPFRKLFSSPASLLSRFLFLRKSSRTTRRRFSPGMHRLVGKQLASPLARLVFIETHTW